MRPEPSDRCTHPDDEWCDNCFIPARHLGVLRGVEHAADPGVDPDPEAPASPRVYPVHWTTEQIARWQASLTGGANGHTPKVVTDSMVPRPLVDRQPAVDLDALHATLRAEWRAGYVGREQAGRYVALEDAQCVNARHNHGLRAYATPCLDDTVPPYPFIHRATGAAAVGALLAAGACLTVGWKIGEWLATSGRLRAERVRQRWADIWCERLG